VVLGKLLAASWRASFALLAAMPVLALTLLLGGVSGGEFWRTMLALANALFCSLVVGLFVSACCREGQWALVLTLGALAALVGGGPLLDAALMAGRGSAFQALCALTSPGFAFVAAGQWRASDFWRALLVNQAVAWTLLAATCALAQRASRETARASWTWFAAARAWWRYGGSRRRAALRKRLLERSPAQWLASRERWQNVVAWSVALLALGTFGFLWWIELPSPAWVLWSLFAGVLGFALHVAVASQAGRMFLEARQTGALELLLISPLGSEQIVSGQWRALLRLFGWPVALFLAVQLLGTFVAQQAMGGMSGLAAPAPAWVGAGLAVLGTISSVADFAALAWFGMWMGVHARTVPVATLMTVLFVQIVPWFVIGFVTSIVAVFLVAAIATGGLIAGASGTATTWMGWMLGAGGLSVGLTVLKDAVFVGWSHRKLTRGFREAAVRAIVPASPSKLPSAVPPVITQPGK
jgi:hypothetical protein